MDVSVAASLTMPSIGGAFLEMLGMGCQQLPRASTDAALLQLGGFRDGIQAVAHPQQHTVLLGLTQSQLKESQTESFALTVVLETISARMCAKIMLS